MNAGVRNVANEWTPERTAALPERIERLQERAAQYTRLAEAQDHDTVQLLVRLADLRDLLAAYEAQQAIEEAAHKAYLRVSGHADDGHQRCQLCDVQEALGGPLGYCDGESDQETRR